MPLATQKGKAFALKALALRRAASAQRPEFDNSALYAGSPVYLPCKSCGDLIRHSETYLTRTELCTECTALKACGWLE